MRITLVNSRFCARLCKPGHEPHRALLDKEYAHTATHVVSMACLPTPTDDLLIVGVAALVVGLTWPSDLGRLASRTDRPGLGKA